MLSYLRNLNGLRSHFEALPYSNKHIMLSG